MPILFYGFCIRWQINKDTTLIVFLPLDCAAFDTASKSADADTHTFSRFFKGNRGRRAKPNRMVMVSH
jgi:hypothetical protein